MLLRKLLAYRQHPAVIAVHSWSPFFNHPNFFSSTEDLVQTIVTYYGLQSVSVRNALFHPTWQRRENFKGLQWLCDSIHPNTLGHRCTPLLQLFLSLLSDSLHHTTSTSQSTQSTRIRSWSSPPLCHFTPDQEQHCSPSFERLPQHPLRLGKQLLSAELQPCKRHHVNNG